MSAAAADILLAMAWIVVLAPGLAAVTAARPGARAGRFVFVTALLAAAWYLGELTGGRRALHPALTAAGLAMATAGAALHRRARRALGPAFDTRVALPPGGALATTGPYAVVRHPIYASVLLVATGTALAHCSAATLCLAVGLALGLGWKLRREEALLARSLGAAWAEYAARVPAIVPRITRAARR